MWRDLDMTPELLIKRRGGRSHVITTCIGVLYRLHVVWNVHVKKGRALKTLPDFISRSAEHSLWDGDIYMALYTTASRWEPKALAKSGTRTNECGGKLENKEEMTAEEVHIAHEFMLEGLYHISSCDDHSGEQRAWCE